MNMPDEITIPILPCRSIEDMLTFYRALGFEVTYQQSKPNTYACVRRGGIDLHFFSMREYEPANSYSTCIVLVPDVDTLYQTFSDGLRAQYGKRLTAGIPRMTALRNKAEGGRGFNLIDPGGNWIRISQVNAKQSDAEAAATKAPLSQLTRAIRAADLLADSKGDYPAAAKILDAALASAQAENAPAVERVGALVSRAGIAITMDDQPLARTMLAEMRGIALRDDERAALGDVLERAADFEAMLS
jgi:catechol 2,3-dioxygenase-like lactoylglutathione lyase family enzyme